MSKEPRFSVNKLDVIAGLLAAHIAQDAINPTYIRLGQPVMYAGFLLLTTAAITFLSALVTTRIHIRKM